MSSRNQTSKPRIGITMRYNAIGDFYLRREYSEAIEHFGATPLQIPLIAKSEYLQTVIEQLDGILLPGSDSDVDPLLFNEEPRLKLGEVEPRRDHTDLLLIKAAEEKRLPILGICFGMQILNVARGGSLFQDLFAEVPTVQAHQQGEPRNRLSHSVAIEPASRLQTMSGQRQTVLVNSHHHQAIARIGANLKVVARAADGVIEAFEDVRPAKFVVGVQWHPELNWEDDSFSQNIFAAFVEAARHPSDIYEKL